MPLSSHAQALYIRLGRRVASLRDRLPGDVTQADLARRTSDQLSRSAIANIETGRHRVALHQLFILADALECSIGELLPDREAIRVASKVPLGADPDDQDAAQLMERLGSRREETVLHKDSEG